jgi:acyl-CoA dehydrogenase
MMSTAVVDHVREAAARIAADVAAPWADAVDREARFPREAVAALREAKMLSAFVPEALGGRGATLGDLAAACETLGRSCAATAMIYAMHQIEVVCLVRHSVEAPFFRSYLASLAENEWLIASATSEQGVGGDLRRSLCSIEPDGGRLRLTKHAPVISYGEEADDILITARRAPDAAANDQVLVLIRKGQTTLTRTGGWDTLGMRGTRSLGFVVEASCGIDQVVPAPFADIASQSMLPVSHLLWSSVWLGIASDAVARARAFVRAEARRSPGTPPPSALRLAETVADLGTLRGTVRDGLAELDRLTGDPESLGNMSVAIRLNNLKVNAARLAPAIVMKALGVCGTGGYRNDSPYAIGRHLRDVCSAPLMIANDRVLSANAAMLLVCKDE